MKTKLLLVARATVLAALLIHVLPAVADDPPATFQHVVSNGITNYTVDFALHSVRGPNFSIQVQQSDGSFVNYTSAPVRTYIGTVQGLPGAMASGLVRSNGQIYYHVLFEDGTDWINEGGSTLGGPAPWLPNWPDYVTGPGGGGTNVWAAEVGVDVPYAYYAISTNVDAALEMVEHSVNTVDLLYLRDACITHRLGRVVVRAASTQDPYFGFTIVDQHSIEGNNQWNNVLPPSTHDVFLVIATEGGNGVTGGGGIGQNAYSACEHTAAGDFTGLWRHEVGHSWSLGHYDGNTPEGPTINSGNIFARLSGPEEARVLQHRSDRAAYLDNLGPYSNSIPPRASLDRAEYLFGTTNVVIDVLANDHDANGQSLSIIGFATNTTQGGTVALSAGTGPGGRDQLIYTPPPLVSSQLDLFTYRIADTEGREALGNVITRPGDPAAELLGYYSLNEGTGGTAFDASSYKRDGTLSGGAAWTNGVYGGGVFFDGVDDGIYLSSPNHPTNRFTITGWVKRSGNQLPWAALVFSRGANTVMGLNFGVGQELRYHWNDAGWDWDSGLVVPDNTWTFVALTVSPTEATIYMDSGSGMVSATLVAAHPVEELDANFAIGTDPARGDRPFKGAMDDVRLYARTMSAAEIAATRNGLGCPTDPSPAHLSQPPAVGFDLSWTPSPAATLHRVFFSTNYLAVRDGTVASSADQGTLTNSSWTPPALAAGSYYWRIDSSDGTNWIAGPVWAFAIQPGTPSLNVEPFTFGNALSFDGVNQYVSITNFGAIAPTNEVTVEFWAYANIVKSQSAFILSPDQSTNRLNGHISFSNGNTYWDFGNINTAGRLSYPNPSGTVSNWTHYAFVASSNGNSMRIYRNGVLDTSKAGMTPFRRGTYELRVGGDGGVGAFNGRLDDFRVWNTARSSNEIAANYNHPLVGNEPGLLLYYQFDAAGGSVASNSANATSSAYNGTLVNAPAWQSSDAPFAYFADGSTNVVDGILLNVSSEVYVGNNGPNTALIITNSGTLNNSGPAYLGVNTAASNNLAMVTGDGSLWSVGGNLFAGFASAGNQLTVSGGGVVANSFGIIGYSSTASNNAVLVTGAGSLWTNSSELRVGSVGGGSQLVVSNGGVAASANGTLGGGTDSSDNVAVVSGAGSLWTNSGELRVGISGSGNQLVVSDGGTVNSSTVTVGFNTGSINNRTIVDGGNLIVTNSGGTGSLDIRQGTNVLNAGLIQTDNLLLNNSAGFFDFNGGTLITGSGTVYNGQPFVVGASGGTTPAILDVRNNAPLTVNNDFTLGANTAASNQLRLTNGGTLSVTGTSYVGTDASSTNNLVTISGSNSLWTNSSELYFGYFGSGNQLVVSDGGKLADGFAYIGLAASASNNVAVVTGPGSTWTNTGDFRVGGFGSGNQLVVSDGGTVVSGTGYFAANSGESSNNLAMVTGPNSRWLLNSILNLGYLGGGSWLVVSDGGTVQATSAYVGVNSSSTNNRVTVAGGNLIVTNSGGTGTLDIRRGTNVLNAGLIQADSLLLNNGTGFLEFNGGMLITRGGTVDNGQDFVVGTSGTNPAILNLESGALTLNNGFKLGANTAAAGNQLLLTNGGNLSVTGISYVGAKTNASNNLAVVSGTGSLWTSSSDLHLGYFGSGNQLVVSDGGVMANASGHIGSDSSSSNNVVVVTGMGSLWTNNGDLYFGGLGSGNQLVVSNGGVVFNAFGNIGLFPGSDRNVAVVTGTGSLWTNTIWLSIGNGGSGNQLVVSSNGMVAIDGGLQVGSSGSGNQLVVSDGGVVAHTTGTIGSDPSSSNNVAEVTGTNSRWALSGTLGVGESGGGNQLVVSDGGTVQTTSAYVGVNSSSTHNRVTVDGGNLIVTNSGGTGTLDIRRGTNVFNAGLIQADSLLLNNGTGFFEFNGGTLLTSGSTVDNGQAFVVGDGSSPATLNLTGNGLHTFTDGLVISGAAMLSGAATLTGNGTVAGQLTVQQGGYVIPGNSVGKLVLNNSPVLQGAVLMEISKTGANLTGDQIQVGAPLTYDGFLSVINLGPTPLGNGDSFKLFDASSYAGSFLSPLVFPVLPAGLMWTNQLLVNGTIAVVPQTAPKISSVTQAGTNLVMNITGGPPGWTYELHSSTNVAQPLASWPVIQIGYFDWLGNVTVTNGISLAEPQRYFSVLAILGGVPD